MSDNLQLENLLKKLINRKLSEDELYVLSEEFKSDMIFEELDRYFLKIWDQSSKESNVPDPEKMLDQLHRKLSVDNAKPGSGKLLFKSGVYLKYAAVFVIAFGLSWTISTWYGKRSVSSGKLSAGHNEITVSYGSKSKIRLPDGSVVNLNSGSKLIYPSVFTGKNRNVNLEGEAYFNIQADSARPFFVHTSDIIIKALGTAFNVKSYPDANTIETTLVSGSLEITERKSLLSGLPGTGKHLLLSPNQKAVFIKDIDSLTVKEKDELHIIPGQFKIPKISLVERIDPQPVTAWKDNKLIFNNERFEDLAVVLERWYNIKINIKSRELKNERFTGIFENETTEQVLNALKIAEPFEYTMDKNNIVIFNKRDNP